MHGMVTLKAVLRVVVVGLAAGIAGCGGSGGSKSRSTTGELVVGLTDAPGDFLVYKVDVLSVSLQNASGANVQTLPNTTTVDFNDVVEVTEFLTAATVPSGVYTAATLRLDYSNADIQVDVNGTATKIPVNKILDASGNVITTLDVSVQLSNVGSVPIVPGVPAHLTLDFDLDASNTVDTTNPAIPELTVEPLLVGQANPTNPKPHRLRGPLVSTDAATSSFKLNIRPFRSSITGGSHGQVTVTTDSSTVFEVDGQTASGTTGFNLLAAKPATTAVVAQGSLNVAGRSYTATEVYAGSSVPFGTQDIVTGTVVARTGDVLTVKGATLNRSLGTVSFNQDVTVTVDSVTKVTKALASSGTFTKADISVGQFITATGTATGATAPIPFNATGTTGLVRMMVSALAGNVIATPSGSVTLNVQRMNGRRIALYNFTGTGTTSPNDANPADYTVSLGALTVPTGATILRVLGFPVGFGTAGSSDYIAKTVVDPSDSGALLAWGWKPASATPFSSTTAAGFLLSAPGLGAVHHVVRAGITTDLTGRTPEIAASGAATDRYVLRVGSSATVYTSITSFLADVNTLLGQGRKAVYSTSIGKFTDSTTRLTASRITVGLR
ncbi:MAG: DUF4382 domain-containing protein [Planctomycetes bacterium]|nr:DUF4382 domain-containing protein [Planctomycetota bacterium]